jgi:DHA2 family multidrug resistance protein
MLWPIIISGVGSGMVFVPLSTISMGTLKNEQIGNATGLFNLLRNVGGGIGISLVNTLVARHAQIHRADLAHNLSQGSPAFQQTFQGLRGAMAQQAQPNVATERAYGLIQNTLDAQSSAFSYVDVFRYIALACFGCGLIVFFMQRVRAKKGAAALAH